jgi:hypothetical protein
MLDAIGYWKLAIAAMKASKEVELSGDRRDQLKELAQYWMTLATRDDSAAALATPRKRASRKPTGKSRPARTEAPDPEPGDARHHADTNRPEL